MKLDTARTSESLHRYLESVPEGPPGRIVIHYPTPAVDGGRYPAKRCAGDAVTVEADIFRDGHELLRAVVRYRGPGTEEWSEAGLEPIDAHLGGVRWAGQYRARPDRDLALHG